MNREELQRYVGVTGYSLGQVEKDYFQHIVLSALSRTEGSILVFKGGTALQKTGVIPRFSEDLDFTTRDTHLSHRICEVTVDAITRYNIPVEVDNMSDTEAALNYRLKIQGLLYKDRRSVCTIRIEISKREAVLRPPEQRELAPPYTDILPYSLYVMHWEEILAEKIRAVYTRQRARDLYDLSKLWEHGTRFDEGLATQKLAYYHLSFDASAFLARAGQLRPLWDRELQSLVQSIPPFDHALQNIQAMISSQQEGP